MVLLENTISKRLEIDGDREGTKGHITLHLLGPLGELNSILLARRKCLKGFKERRGICYLHTER